MNKIKKRLIDSLKRKEKEKNVSMATLMLLCELSPWQLGCSQHWLTSPWATPTSATAANSHTGHIVLQDIVTNIETGTDDRQI